jgi:hypothetical protein
MLRGFVLAVLLQLSGRLAAWDYEFHRLVNELALASLPGTAPEFLREPAVRERLAYLAGEADRWRNVTAGPLRHVNEPDHFLDLEDLDPLGMDPSQLTPFREEFVAQVAVARARQPLKFPAATNDPARNRWLPGFLPWKVAEECGRLRSSWSTLKTFERHGGRPDEIANARANVIHVMGVLGHYVGDASQPLHTTRHYNGWVGDNPRGYTTNRTFHGFIDGGFLRAAGLDRARILEQIRPATLPWSTSTNVPGEPVFPLILSFVREQHALVEPLYALELGGKLKPGSDAAAEGREFLGRQLLKAGQLLGDLWLASWTQATNDTYLQSWLARRAAAESNGSQKAAP